MQSRFFLFLVSILISSTLCARESLRVETYGDSLTAGFLADTSLIQTPEISKLSGILKELAFGFIEKNREILKKFEANDKSWPHYLSEQLQESGKKTVRVENLAVSGSKSEGILTQVKMAGTQVEPTWALFFVGHNDLCHVKGDNSLLVSQFNRNLESALAIWEENHQNSIVFLIPPAPIYQLYPVLDNYIWFESEQKTFKCQDAWTKYFPYCSSFYFRYRAGELETFLKPRGESLKQSLVQIAFERDKTSKRGNRYFYLDAEWPLPLRPEYFALDCYHIAEQGQRIFARNIFNALTRTLPYDF